MLRKTHIDKSFPISVCSVFTPRHDTNGKVINDFTKFSEIPNYVFLNVVPTGTKTYIFGSTLKRQSAAVSSFMTPFTEKDPDKFLDYLSETILKYTENFIISPDYWQQFSENKRTAVASYFNETVLNKIVPYNPTLHNLFIQ